MGVSCLSYLVLVIGQNHWHMLLPLPQIGAGTVRTLATVQWSQIAVLGLHYFLITSRMKGHDAFNDPSYLSTQG